MRRPRHHAMRAAGFTLAEALLASAVLLLAIEAITYPFASAARNEREDARRSYAMNLAQELMDEILDLPFLDPNGVMTPGPEARETSRALYDNIDDYHGLSENEGNVRTLDGEVATGDQAAGLSRQAFVRYLYLPGQDTSQTPSACCVTVTVNYKGQPIVMLNRLVYNPQ